MRSIAALVALVSLTVACGGASAEDPDDPLGQILLASAPDGFVAVEGPASGPMDLSSAATSTEISQTKLRGQLNRTGFQGGYSRVWTHDDDFVAALVFGFLNAGRASELVTFQAEELSRKESAQPFRVASIDGAKGFTVNARSDDGTTLFCQIVWFARDTNAFEVRVCRTQPGSTEEVVGLAETQAELARG